MDAGGNAPAVSGRWLTGISFFAIRSVIRQYFRGQRQGDMVIDVITREETYI